MFFCVSLWFWCRDCSPIVYVFGCVWEVYVFSKLFERELDGRVAGGTIHPKAANL